MNCNPFGCCLVNRRRLRAHSRAATLCRLVLRYFQNAPAPYHYLLNSDGSAAASDAALAAQLARSTLRALQLSPQLSWPVVAALPALLQHPMPDVRWCAVGCAALVFGLQDASKSKVGLRLCPGLAPAELRFGCCHCSIVLVNQQCVF
jgi:hypothetical protein